MERSRGRAAEWEWCILGRKPGVRLVTVTMATQNSVSPSLARTLEPFHLLPETVKCAVESDLQVLFQNYDWSGSLCSFIHSFWLLQDPVTRRRACFFVNTLCVKHASLIWHFDTVKGSWHNVPRTKLRPCLILSDRFSLSEPFKSFPHLEPASAENMGTWEHENKLKKDQTKNASHCIAKILHVFMKLSVNRTMCCLLAFLVFLYHFIFQGRMIFCCYSSKTVSFEI